MNTIKRTLIFRECPDCKVGAFVRKDSAGKLCRKCRAFNNSKIPHYKDILGLKFGKLLVTKFSGILNNRSYYWDCLCDCGNEIFVHGNRLRSGKTKSCGCLSRKVKGQSTTLMYRKWKSIIARCYNPKNISYKNYGARGITVCDEWKNSFDKFLKDMGHCPDGYTIDRIDNNGHYSPDNCRWSNTIEQQNNRRNNQIINCFDKSLTLTEWSKYTGIYWSTLRKRIFDLKWPVEKALSLKAGKRKKK